MTKNRRPHAMLFQAGMPATCRFPFYPLLSSLSSVPYFGCHNSLSSSPTPNSHPLILLWSPYGSLISSTPSFFLPFFPLPRMVVRSHPLLIIASPSYLFPDFQVTYPTQGAQLANGQTFSVTWTKGLLDGVNFFDLELTRMNTNGLILIARDSRSQAALIHHLSYY